MKIKIFTFVMRHRLRVSSGVLLLTLFFAWFTAQAQFNNTLESYFLKADIAAYDRFLGQFGSDEIIAIAFADEQIFTPENLRLIGSISTELEFLPHVRRVISLSTVRLVSGDEENVYFDPLIDEIPTSAAETLLIKKRALADPFIPRILISQDAKRTAIVAEIDHIIGEFDYKIILIEQIRALLAGLEKSSGKKFYLGGSSVLDEAFFRYNQRDQMYFMPFVLLLIIAIVWLMFRSFRLVIVPVAVMILTMIWTYGLLVILGYQINVITTIIPPLLMAVAIADSIHFIADYLHECAADNESKIQALQVAFSNVFIPCLMTSVTTALGLLSLLSADLAIFREFGLVAAGGVLFAFMATVTVSPVLLSLMPFPDAQYRGQYQAGIIAKFLLWLGNWRKLRSAAILAMVCIAALPAIWLLPQLEIGTNSLDYLKKDDSIRSQIEWIDSKVGGTVSLEFLIQTGEGTLRRPAILRKMAEFQNYLQNIEGITGVYSAVDLVKALNRGFHGGDEKFFTIPPNRLEIVQQLFLVEGSDDLASLLSEDYTIGRISARVEIDKSQQIARRIEKINLKMAAIFPDSITIFPTGLVYLINRTEHYLLTSSVKSFLLAFVVITLVIMVFLRSVKLGILAIIPNFLPILFTIALMPLLHISLDVGTTMIAAVALGLVVDDTIHFLTRLHRESRNHPDLKSAIGHTIQSVGRPIVFTSVVLGSGFFILVFASFNPLINFGLLAAIVILLALFFDLFVLPALLGFLQIRLAKKN